MTRLIDPPFFSGRNYNVIFGDKNEVRSFSDIWEGGMPGYLVWLNARLFEMKRLLKQTGSIYVHLDWHASHYVRVGMDKIFGVDNFINEVVWSYKSGGNSKNTFARKHDVLLFYSKTRDYEFKAQYYKSWQRKQYNYNPNYPEHYDEKEKMWYHLAICRDVWDDVFVIGTDNKERIGYPTQKPESLLERMIQACAPEGGIVADFFCGGGTTPAVAQRLNRRWIACDQSRIAVAVTADRITKAVREKVGNVFPVPDFTVEHWGIYEAPKLEQYTSGKFREFVVKAFGGRPENVSKAIHGVRYGIPLYVGEPSRQTRITKNDVAIFAKAVYEERRANHGVMLGWNFGQDARQAAEIFAARENKRIDFVRLSLIRLEDDEFREHVVNKNKDYAPLLCFIQPPKVRVKFRRLKSLTYEFDVSESVSLNKDGVIANVQWDFNHKLGRFTSTQGYSFLRDKKTGQPVLVVEYPFRSEGEYTVACSLQDDQGGEHTVVIKVEVK